jgi:hypothetical protein
MSTTYLVEASHLFRAGDKYSTQFFVCDVVNFLKRSYFPDEDSHTIVLHGSTKEEQAMRYSAALERHGVRVIRMSPIPSLNGEGKHFYKPTYYIHQMMGKEILPSSDVVLIGFHNSRYLSFLQKYHKEFRLSMAAFMTPSRRQGFLKIPAEFIPLLHKAICLDEFVADIKSEWKKKS